MYSIWKKNTEGNTNLVWQKIVKIQYFLNVLHVSGFGPSECSIVFSIILLWVNLPATIQNKTTRQGWQIQWYGVLLIEAGLADAMVLCPTYRDRVADSMVCCPTHRGKTGRFIGLACCIITHKINNSINLIVLTLFFCKQ